MRPLTNTELKLKLLNLIEENGIKDKREFIYLVQSRVSDLEKDEVRFTTGKGKGFADSTLYAKLNDMGSRPFTAEEITVFADVLDVDTDYLLTDTKEKRKRVSDVAEYLGVSDKTVQCILSMKSHYHPIDLGYRIVEQTGFETTGLEALLNDKGSEKLFDILGEQKILGDSFKVRAQVHNDGEAILTPDDTITQRAILDLKIHRIIDRIVDRLRGED